jgi:Ca2+-binding EF-hand superfamily protein
MYKAFTMAALIGMSTASFAGEQTVNPTAAAAKKDAYAAKTMSYEQLDTDRDGQISREEAQQSEWVKSRFDNGDKNSDGRLDRTEFDGLKR